MSRHRPQRLSPQDKLVQEKVKAERLRRQKIEAELPPKEPDYTRLEDLPPLHPDDEAKLKAEFYALTERVQNSNIENAIAYYTTSLDVAVQDWHDMDRAVRNLPKQKRTLEPINLIGIPSELFPMGTATTDIWGGITHNGDHPWDSGRFKETREGQRWAARLEDALSGIDRRDGITPENDTPEHEREVDIDVDREAPLVSCAIG